VGVLAVELHERQPGTGVGQALLDAGYSLVMIDAPSDMLASPGILFPHRVTAAHAAELLAVVQFVQQRDNLPAWLMGFSAGGPSVANVAINAIPAVVALGLVLSIRETMHARRGSDEGRGL